MARHKNNKNKNKPNYNFLVSWSNDGVHVNRESILNSAKQNPKLSASKKAAELAKEDSIKRIKKDIFKSLILVSLILIIETVVYLARSRFGIK